jgi:hypothetical protein
MFSRQKQKIALLETKKHKCQRAELIRATPSRSLAIALLKHDGFKLRR